MVRGGWRRRDVDKSRLICGFLTVLHSQLAASGRVEVFETDSLLYTDGEGNGKGNMHMVWRSDILHSKETMFREGNKNAHLGSDFRGKETKITVKRSAVFVISSSTTSQTYS